MQSWFLRLTSFIGVLLFLILPLFARVGLWDNYLSFKLYSGTNGIYCIGIDEAQFFDLELPKVCEKLALKGIRVIVAGLDMDFRGVPFGPIPHLLATAEYITKVHAICPHCGALATHSYRLSTEDATVVLGEKDKYEPRCRVCYEMGNILDFTS